MSDSAGVTLVSNTNVGIWAPGNEWTFGEEVRIGVDEGQPEYQFGRVHRIAVDSRDRIFVLDDIEQHIQVYSPEGVYEQTVGGRGQGPGELQAAMFLLMGAGDTLLVPDGRNLRFNRYAPDGSAIGSFRMPLELGRPIVFEATPSGVIAGQIRPSAVPGERAPETPMDVLVLLATDGTVTDTLLTFPSGEMIGPGGVHVFAPEPTWDLTDDLQLAFGVTDDYRISLYTGGRIERVISKLFERTPVSDQDEAAIMREMERRWASEASVSEELKARLRSRWSFADLYPAYQRLAFGPVGTIWVQQVKPVNELSEEELENWQNARVPEWDVFDSEGRYLGAVVIPETDNVHYITALRFFRDRTAGTWHMLSIWKDELDVEYIVRWRVDGRMPEESTET